ncbi:MAG: cytochrome c [Acidobacteria bacterium]|nr:cytochrome c [Acidobacteriota bacterium]
MTRSCYLGVQGLLLATLLAAFAAAPAPALAQAGAEHEVTFSRDIAPILQRSCQKCHRPDALAPMSLIDYHEVRPWARAIKNRTGLRDKPGVMPPWYIEKDIGIQGFKDDPSLSEEEIRKIATWVDNGAPEGDPADLPPPVPFIDVDEWEIGEPDLIVSSPSVDVPGEAPDWWGSIGEVDSGLAEDRYVAALEFKEVTESRSGQGRNTVGGLFVIHHSSLGVVEPDADEEERSRFNSWPVHEVGRNADFFNPDGGKLMKAGSKLRFQSVHLHSNGADTRAHLDVGFKFHPRGYEPTVKTEHMFFGNGVDLDIEAMDADQTMEAYFTLPEHAKISIFEPHMHAPGYRMCLEAIWGINVETLNCAGYDHSWVRVYTYDDDVAPLLPKGTILRITGYFNNSPSNPNVPDPRNWSGGGHRSVDQMFINLMRGVYLTEEQFQTEMEARRQAANIGAGDRVTGCPLCGAAPESAAADDDAGDQQ